MVYDRPKGL
ncbi:84a66cdb-326e-4772-918a-7edcf600c766 [Thermothielavioides terrestris]|uniref:84a66cdb-326e-4772-918a-7edcf600c766 n=1 Tax=Thermothielavioides terrestris TaxID=2587410 RepID=A0A3S4B7B2_9PEZI|nr:84a66cdb-326e-4772-918a-7edcf600c766 [Thermothielavioides terrestris]